MKTIIIFLLAIISSLSFSQDYQLFNSTSKKLFTTYPEKTSTYSLSFDSVKLIGNDSVYFNFYKIEDLNFVSYDCDFWIGPDCYKQNIPVWFGDKVEYDNLHSYNFFPDNGDTIQFHFYPIYEDTTIFYQDNFQRFSLTYEGTDTLTVLNYTDSVRYFIIHHTDLDGNIIYSQLNGQNIIIGKTLGLVQFFQIDEFPEILNPVYLIGHKNPSQGIINITKGMLCDYQPGDEIQFQEENYYSSGPPSWSWIRFTKHTILSRVETTDSIKYVMDELIFYEDSSLVISNIIEETFYKNEIIAQIPFEKFDGNYKQFYLGDYCDLKLWTYHIEAENSLEYCEIDNVWGYFDTNGPPDINKTTWVLGLGLYDNYNVSTYGGWEFHTYHLEIIYFNKDDVICGEEIIVGEHGDKIISDHFIIYPNPSEGLLNIKSKYPNSEKDYNFELLNIFGQLTRLEKNIQSPHYSMNVADLKAGMYLYVIKQKNEIIQQGKLVVQ